jgi:hypothetical protein
MSCVAVCRETARVLVCGNRTTVELCSYTCDAGECAPFPLGTIICILLTVLILGVLVVGVAHVNAEEPPPPHYHPLPLEYEGIRVDEVTPSETLTF